MEFLHICQFLGCNPKVGISFKAFDQLINDVSAKGCFCSNEDLRLISKLGTEFSKFGMEVAQNLRREVRRSSPGIPSPVNMQGFQSMCAFVDACFVASSIAFLFSN